MVLFTVEEYPNEIQNDIEEMQKQGYSNEEIVSFMHELKEALEEKIEQLEGW